MQCYVQKGKWTASRRPGIDGQVTKWPTWRCPQLLGWRVHLLPRFLVRIRFRHFFLNRVAEFGPLQYLQRMNENFWNFLFKKLFNFPLICKSIFKEIWFEKDPKKFIHWFEGFFGTIHQSVTGSGRFVFDSAWWMDTCVQRAPPPNEWVLLRLGFYFCLSADHSRPLKMNEIFFFLNFIHSVEMFRIDCYRRRHCWLIWHFVAEEREREDKFLHFYTLTHTVWGV